MDFIRLDLTTVLLPSKLWTPSHQVCRESRQLLTHLYLHSPLPVRCQHITSIASYNQQHYSGRLEKNPWHYFWHFELKNDKKFKTCFLYLCVGPRGDAGWEVHSGQSTPERSEAVLQHLASASGIAPWSSEAELISGVRNWMDIFETCVYNTRKNVNERINHRVATIKWCRW